MSSVTSFVAFEPSTAIECRRLARLLDRRRLALARAAVADVRDELRGVGADLLVDTVRPLLDRVGRRLRAMALGGERLLPRERVEHEAGVEEGGRDLVAVGRAGLLDRRYDGVCEVVAAR